MCGWYTTILYIDRVVGTIAELRWRERMMGLICAWLTVPSCTVANAIVVLGHNFMILERKPIR